MNGCVSASSFDPGAARLTINRWVRGEAVKCAAEVTAALEACAFDQAAGTLYRFIWNLFCDWYVEFAKPIFQGADEAAATETRAMAAWALDQILALLHPVSPFLTEELWAQTAPNAGRPSLLISAPWPELPGHWRDPAAEKEIGLIIATVTEGRSLRAELNVPPGGRPDLIVIGAGFEERLMLETNRAVIAHTLRAGEMTFASVLPAGAVPFVAAGVSFALLVGALIDLAGERARLAKDIAAWSADIDKTARKLANADFVSRAPEEVVEENRERLADAEAARARLAAMLERLSVIA